jgi:hypothetical protein
MVLQTVLVMNMLSSLVPTHADASRKSCPSIIHERTTDSNTQGLRYVWSCELANSMAPCLADTSVLVVAGARLVIPSTTLLRNSGLADAVYVFALTVTHRDGRVATSLPVALTALTVPLPNLRINIAVRLLLTFSNPHIS